MELGQLADQQQVPLPAKSQPHLRPSSPSRSHPQHSAIIALQRTAGNAAVTKLLAARAQQDRFKPALASAIAVQRCGSEPCNCVSGKNRHPPPSATPADKHEQTTKSIAKQVMTIAEPLQPREDLPVLDLSSSDEKFANLQRTPKDAKAPKDKKKKQDSKDIVLILSPTSEKADSVTQAAVIAPDAQILYAKSLKEMVTQLKTLKAPVRTLYFIGHSNADGDIVFETPGSSTFVSAATIADQVKGVVQVESIDFLGCASGASPGEIDKVRTATKAKKARASTCELVRQIAGPIKTPKGKAITDRATFDLTKPNNRKLFDTGLKMLRDSFGDDRKKCIVNDSEDGYFQAHGKLLAVWANPESIAGTGAFDKGKSTCYGNLKVEKVDPSKNPVIDENECKLIELG